MDPLLTPRRGADELGGVLQRKFQTSASVTRLPGKADTGKEIALQGNLLHVRPRGAARSFAARTRACCLPHRSLHSCMCLPTHAALCATQCCTV